MKSKVKKARGMVVGIADTTYTACRITIDIMAVGIADITYTSCRSTD